MPPSFSNSFKIDFCLVVKLTGISTPVTVLSIEKGRILDVITKEKRGYDAIRVGFGKIKTSKLTKQMDFWVNGTFSSLYQMQYAMS